MATSLFDTWAEYNQPQIACQINRSRLGSVSKSVETNYNNRLPAGRGEPADSVEKHPHPPPEDMTGLKKQCFGVTGQPPANPYQIVGILG